jgi:hypothetical protein
MKGIGIETVPSVMETDHPHSKNVFCKHRNRVYERLVQLRKELA